MENRFLKSLNKISAETILTLFQKKTEVAEIYNEETIPSFKVRYYAQIGLRCKTFQGSIILGFSETKTRELLSEILALAGNETEAVELARSALGELANEIACSFAALDEVKKTYGNLGPTPPLVWVTEEKIPDFYPADGMSSALSFARGVIHTYFCMNPFEPKSEADLHNWNPTQSLSIFDPNGPNL